MLYIGICWTLFKSISRIPALLLLGPCFRLYIFIAAMCSMEALGYPPLSNLGTAVHSLPCLQDIGLINPVHNQLFPLPHRHLCCCLLWPRIPSSRTAVRDIWIASSHHPTPHPVFSFTAEHRLFTYGARQSQKTSVRRPY